MNVNDYFTNGYCEECDCDPTQCYNQGYCQYDKDNGNLDEDETKSKIEQLDLANYELEKQVLDLKLELSDRDKQIERLKEHNGNEVRMRCDMQRKFDDLQTLCTEQKAEIERLKDENCHDYHCMCLAQQEKAELQKQVDELTDKLGKVLSGINADELLVAKGIEQAVKDVGKEILREGKHCLSKSLREWIKERCGLEAE